MNPFRRKYRYKPPNPAVPAFVSEGGTEMWHMLLDIRERLAAVEARQTILMALLILAVGASIAKEFL